MWHEERDFVANILYQGVYHDTLANYSGVVTVCEDRAHIIDVDRCLIVTYSFDEFIWFNDSNEIQFLDDQNMFHMHGRLKPWQYQVMDNEVIVCVMNWPLQSLESIVNSCLSMTVTSISALALILTLVTYLSFKELRNLPGLNMMSLSIDMLLYLLLMLFGVNRWMDVFV